MPCQNKNVVKPHEILHSGEVAKMMHNGLVYNRKSLSPNLAQPWTQKKIMRRIWHDNVNQCHGFCRMTCPKDLSSLIEQAILEEYMTHLS